MAEMLNIHQRIDRVRSEVAYLKKDKKVETYWAVTHDMVTAEVRPFLIQYGINMVVRQVTGEIQETGKATKSGNPITRYVAFYEIDFVNIDDPKDRETTSIGSIAEDHGDKAPGKCLSYAVKAIMLKTFNVETGESDESRIESKPEPITPEDLLVLTEICESKNYYKEDADEKLKSLAERVYQLKKIEDLPKTRLADAMERLTKMPQKES